MPADINSQFDQIWGTTTPTTPPQPANNARMQEIMNLGNNTQQPNQTPSTLANSGQGSDTAGSLMQKIFPGISDLKIEGMYGRNINAECKTITGVQSTEQKAIQLRIENLKGVYFVFRSLIEFQLKISDHIDWLMGK